MFDAVPVSKQVQLSWKRSQLSGVSPDLLPDAPPPLAEVDTSSRLMTASTPVLDQMSRELKRTTYSVLLADADCRLVHRWFDHSVLETTLGSLGLFPGAPVREDMLGTNALGTAAETRHGIVLNGSDHFLNAFKQFSCYGHPIINPVTQHLEGVLDVTGPGVEVNPLLAPFVARAAADIQTALLDATKASERAILLAFQTVSRRRRRPVVAIGEDLVLANRAALDLLEPADYAALRRLCADVGSTKRNAELALAAGPVVRVDVARVDGTGDGALFEFEVAPARRSAAAEHPVACGPVLIHGAPGTGRTTEARRLAPDVVVFDCAEADRNGMWSDQLVTRIAAGESIIVDNLELLPEPQVPPLVAVLAAGTASRVVFTSAPLRELTGRHAALAAMLVDQVELTPIASRVGQIPALASRLIYDLNPAANLRLIPSVVDILGSQAWPGNLHELRAVLAHVVRNRTVGDVTTADLPETHRTPGSARKLAGRERAERDAIVAAVKAAEGNKSKAAQELGISRTTLYARIRALKIV